MVTKAVREYVDKRLSAFAAGLGEEVGKADAERDRAFQALLTRVEQLEARLSFRAAVSVVRNDGGSVLAGRAE